MKRVICLIILIGAMLLCGTSALAGSIPEDLLFDDNTMLYFGELVSYNKSDNRITILPTQKIKGEVDIGNEQTYTGVDCVGNSFTPVRGTTYLMAYFDDNNPLYIFRITGTDTEDLTIEGITGTVMWECMQEYLNEGKYEQAEAKRLSEINGSSPSSVIPTPVPSPVYKASGFLRYGGISYLILTGVAVAVALGIIVISRKKKSKQMN